jgi:hypothetical protein
LVTVEAKYVQVRGAMTPYEVGDVLRAYGAAYRAQYPVTPTQARVMGALSACRTAALGGRVYECQVCGAVEFAYYSCRDRHCPKCQKFARAQWVEQQKALVLPVPYFHVIFTTDHAVNVWLPQNQAVIYNLLFTTAAGVLKDFAGRELGGELGITAVLHTWSQTLLEHVHLHCVVTGGALSFDQQSWRRSPAGYLFDIVAVSAVFRDQFCTGLQRLAQRGQLVGVSAAEVATTVAAMQAQNWEVFIKPFDEPTAVIEYLSRYVQSVAISNYRITDIVQGQVSFTYHDNRAGGEVKELTLSALEFIRRFLLHVLPDQFVRIRYYGLHHSAARKTKLARVRALLGVSPEPPVIPKLELPVWLETVLGVEVYRCRWCGTIGGLVYRGEVVDMTWLWVWLKLIIGTLFAGRWYRVGVAA